MAAFELVHSFAGFLAVAIASSLFRSVSGTATIAVMSRLGEGEERVRICAYQHSVSNFGMGLGMAIAAVAFVGSEFFVMKFPAMPMVPPLSYRHCT